jgi:hypothetical protein
VKSAEIKVGGEYIVALKKKHVLIPGTDTAYVERLEWFDSLPKDRLDRLPFAALREHKRLRKAVGRGVRDGGLASRISRCLGLYAPGLRDEGHIVTSRPGFLAGSWIGVVCTVTEKAPKAIRVEADFVGQTGALFDHACAAAFDPSIPDDIEAKVEDDTEDVSFEEYEAAMDAVEALLLDPAGTLEARVHPQALRYYYDDGLIERLNAEYEEMVAVARAESERRLAEMRERHAPRSVERAVERILLDADRPADDDWEALA